MQLKEGWHVPISDMMTGHLAGGCRRLPVILTGSEFVEPAVGRWDAECVSQWPLEGREAFCLITVVAGTRGDRDSCQPTAFHPVVLLR